MGKGMGARSEQRRILLTCPRALYVLEVRWEDATWKSSQDPHGRDRLCRFGFFVLDVLVWLRKKSNQCRTCDTCDAPRRHLHQQQQSQLCNTLGCADQDAIYGFLFGLGH